MGTTYREQDAQRVIVLTRNDDGTYEAEDGNLDPFLTIVRRFGKAGTGTAVTITDSTTIHTPASGQAIRLKWVALSTPPDQVDAVATVRLGTDTTYKWSMSSPGAFMRTSIREGEADETFNVVLDTPATVYVNYELEEFTP